MISTETLTRTRLAVRRRVEAVPTPVWILVAMVTAWSAFFGYLTARQHAHFATFGFDMGIYDQGIWLLSRFQDPFVTVRGLHLFANHVDPIYLLFLPAYWLGAGPIFLSVVQAIWIALGAVPIWLMAKERLDNAYLALGLSAAWLLHPSLQWIAWFHFHPEALAATPLLFAWWAATQARWRLFVVMVIVAIACKESVTMAVFVMGLIVAWRWDRKVGLLTSVGAVGWFFVATRLIIPAFNDGSGPFYADLYGPWGDSAIDIAAGIIRNPDMLWETVTESGRVNYYRQLLAPLGFIPLIGGATVLIGAPQVLVNVLSVHSLTHSIRFQYSTIVVAALFLATIAGCARGPMGARRFLVGLVVAASVGGNVAWSPSPISENFKTGIWAERPQPRHATAKAGMAMIPDDARVSASYWLVPHLSHRQWIYEWPNPFIVSYWGVAGENTHDPETIDWLAIDRNVLGDNGEFFDQLVADDFEVMLEADDLVFARRR